MLIHSFLFLKRLQLKCYSNYNSYFRESVDRYINNNLTYMSPCHRCHRTNQTISILPSLRILLKSGDMGDR
jgi:hypothetical protein